MPLRRRRIAVVGASGQVGRMLLKLLCARGVDVSQVAGFASSRSKGHKVSYGDDHTLTLSVLDDSVHWPNFDIVFFAAGSKVSSTWASRAAKAGCFVVDKSSHYRLHAEVPLVVPEVNSHLIPVGRAGLISNPNCVALPLSIVLHALQKHGGVRVESASVSTYQSVSGAGHDGMQTLDRQTGKHHMNTITQGHMRFETASSPFERQIAFNVLPHIGTLDEETGQTSEESKIIAETARIVGTSVCVTSVRVPVFIGHCMAVHLMCDAPITAEAARVALSQEAALVVDEPHHYTSALDCAGFDDIHVSRVRNDGLSSHGLLLWIACDNLRKGAALNAIHIAEHQSREGA